MKYSKVFDDSTFESKPLTIERLKNIGYSTEEAERLLKEIEKRKSEI